MICLSAPTATVRPVNHGLRASHLTKLDIWVLSILEPVETEKTAVTELASGKVVAIIPVLIPAVCITEPDVAKLRFASVREQAHAATGHCNIELIGRILTQVSAGICHLDNHFLAGNRGRRKSEPVKVGS
jgi:hypothetical protein